MTDSKTQFWLDVASGSLLPHYVLGRISELSAQTHEGEEGELSDEINHLLRRELQYHATIEEIFDAQAAVRNAETGFWTGHYLLVDTAGDTYTLDVADGAVLLSNGTHTVQTHVFDGGVLRLSDDQLSLEVEFSLPEANADTVLAVASRRGQARCMGEVTVLGEKRPIRGKRGCHSAWGIERDEDGDPAAMWEGRYTLIDPETWERREGAVVFNPHEDTVTVTFDDQPCSRVSYLNNHLVCRIGDNPDHRLGALFEVVDGQKRFVGVERNDGVDRPLVGYRTGSLHDLSAPAAQPVRALFAAASNDANDAVNATAEPSKKVAVKLAPDNKKGAISALPDGTERMIYTLEIDASGLDDADGEFVLDDDKEANPEPFMTIRQLMTLDVVSRDKAAKTAKLQLCATQGETHSAAVYNFTITNGKNSARLRLRIFSLAAITISSVAIPPIVRDKLFTTTLTASGGNRPYTWRIATGHLPDGFEVYNAETGAKVDRPTGTVENGEYGWVTVTGTPRISGVTAGLSQGVSQERFGVPVEVTSAGVVMSPTTETLYFQIIEGEQVGGIGANWAAFIIGGVGGLAVLFDWLKGKYSGTEVDKAAKKVDTFVSAEATVTGSFAEHVKSLNDRMIADATTRSTDMASLTNKLQTIADAQALEITRLGNSVDALSLELQRTTDPALRPDVQRRLDIEVKDLREVTTQKAKTDVKKERTKHEDRANETTIDAAKSLKKKTGK